MLLTADIHQYFYEYIELTAFIKTVVYSPILLNWTEDSHPEKDS